MTLDKTTRGFSVFYPIFNFFIICHLSTLLLVLLQSNLGRDLTGPIEKSTRLNYYGTRRMHYVLYFYLLFEKIISIARLLQIWMFSLYSFLFGFSMRCDYFSLYSENINLGNCGESARKKKSQQ